MINMKNMIHIPPMRQLGHVTAGKGYKSLSIADERKDDALAFLKRHLELTPCLFRLAEHHTTDEKGLLVRRVQRDHLVQMDLPGLDDTYLEGFISASRSHTVLSTPLPSGAYRGWLVSGKMLLHWHGILNDECESHIPYMGDNSIRIEISCLRVQS